MVEEEPTNGHGPARAGDGPPAGAGGGPRRLGVVGTLVWDTIHDRDGRSEPVEEWGGISYALEACEAALPDGWEILPMIKVGKDLSERALRFLRELPRTRPEEGVRIVPDPNNRVELRYVDEGRRTERLSGGVPPWDWMELAPLIRSCDAVYVNFISGFEMGLETARSLRAGYDGPAYADLHSLFLGVSRRGIRYPKELPSWREWLRCFDAIQVNEEEFELLGRAWGDPWRLAADVVGPELKLIAVTLGDRGAAYVAGPDFVADPGRWPALRRRMGGGGASRSGRVARDEGPRRGDPTGCGDVWGATFFSRLLAGDGLEEAMEEANRMAGRNVEHRGSRGLHRHLRGQLSR